MDDGELRQLQEDGFRLKELTEHHGWPVLERLVLAQIGARQRELVGGTVQSMEEYRKIVGWLAGAQHVISIPDETLKRAREATTK